jgi:FkbM family methyltransferase
MTNTIDGYINTPLPIERELRLLFRPDATITIFDIGACEGEDSVRYARLFPRSTVYAVEPIQANVGRIKAIVERYGVRNVRILPFALSDVSGSSRMFVSAGHPPDVPVSDGWDYGNKSSSLLEPGHHLEVHPWVRFDEVIEVQTRTLADVCADYSEQRVDFIHMDVQGAELKVLDGLGALLEGVIAIWLEVATVPMYLGQPLRGDVEGYLRAHGFHLSMDTVDDVSGDQLWVHETAIDRLGPVVSVVLPVYNCPRYVGQAVESILAQTCADFELIVVDDGSEDETPDVVRRFTDPRIRLVTQANRGLAGALNRGIELARGRYIARQDQDDVSFPERVAKQVAFLDAHPRCALVGTWAEIWRGDERTDRVHAHPSDNANLKFQLLLNNPFVHSSVMIRRAALDRVGAYSTDPGRQPPEDYELWSRVAREFEVANLPEVLHIYREVEGSISRLGPSPFVDHLVTLCAENIAWAAGVESTDPQVINIAALVHGADHRVQCRPDFATMRDILRRAAARVAPVAGEPFSRDAGRLIDELRYRAWERRYAHDWRRHIVRAARRVARLARPVRRT